jgi:hypothetical protein
MRVSTREQREGVSAIRVQVAFELNPDVQWRWCRWAWSSVHSTNELRRLGHLRRDSRHHRLESPSFSRVKRSVVGVGRVASLGDQPARELEHGPALPLDVSGPEQSMLSRDAIVIGTEHNGLTPACYLARAGLMVLVLEPYAELDGRACTRVCVSGGSSRERRTAVALVAEADHPEDHHR